MLDAKDNLAAGPVDLIVDPTLSENNPNSSTQTAGATFMGQFMDHDMTFHLTSRLGVPADPTDSPNSRTPGLDLDFVYGGGPLADPELYVLSSGRRLHHHPTRFKIESGGLFEDVPRDRHGTAIIADPRNDENLSGLQAAFLSFHNSAVDLVATSWKVASTSAPSGAASSARSSSGSCSSIGSLICGLVRAADRSCRPRAAV